MSTVDNPVQWLWERLGATAMHDPSTHDEALIAVGMWCAERALDEVDGRGAVPDNIEAAIVNATSGLIGELRDLAALVCRMALEHKPHQAAHYLRTLVRTKAAYSQDRRCAFGGRQFDRQAAASASERICAELAELPAEMDKGGEA